MSVGLGSQQQEQQLLDVLATSDRQIELRAVHLVSHDARKDRRKRARNEILRVVVSTTVDQAERRCDE